MKHIFPIIFVLTIVLSCSEEEEGSFFYEPTVEVQFFNIDSLVIVDGSLADIKDTISALTDTLKYWNDSIKVLNDTISKISILIDSGQSELSDKKLIFEQYLELFSSNVVTFTKVDSVMDVKNASLKGIKSDIESGLMLLSSIQNAQNGKTRTYQDSTEFYYFPMDMNADSSSYTLEIAGMSYNLALDYQRVNDVDEKSRVIVTAFDISKRRHTFDSVKVNCKTDLCKNAGVSIQVYY